MTRFYINPWDYDRGVPPRQPCITCKRNVIVLQIKRDEHIHLADGRSATLSAVQFSDGAYETMLLKTIEGRDGMSPNK